MKIKMKIKKLNQTIYNNNNNEKTIIIVYENDFKSN